MAEGTADVCFRRPLSVTSSRVDPVNAALDGPADGRQLDRAVGPGHEARHRPGPERQGRHPEPGPAERAESHISLPRRAGRRPG
jgi:hypothetical protein